eukprot:TRINITY_DN283_c0_g1_i1.p1 TRINITY_DN283_c0_g1~~TRINITY_DN283_c0_g1_i1.p1  ORF type:complete len:533 (-),score=76.23 TRINITY_DN283_c0_g1_i1:231-1829(-)
MAVSEENVADAGFGGKHIGFVGGFSMMLNNVLGPGVANFSGMYQRSGWLGSTTFILLCALTSLASGEMLIMAMRAMPGNERFEKRVEFSTLCRHYFSRPLAIFCNFVFQLSMLAVNIGNIVQTAQVFDNLIDTLFNDSCALMMYPTFGEFFCGTSTSDISPFGKDKVLISFGACIVALLSIPLGFYNLDDNVFVQNVSMVLIMAGMVVWVGLFIALDLEADRVPMVPSDWSGYHGMGGTILFNFMFISTLPSWVCEKKPSVRAMNVISLTLIVSVLLFVMVGVLGGMAFEPYWMTDNTLLSKLHKIKDFGLTGKILGNLSVDIYAVAANMASIPIFSIMMRYNLIEEGIMGPKRATLVSVVLPWVISILLYCGEGFQNIVQFSGAFTSSIVNLIVPCLLFISCQQIHSRQNSASSDQLLAAVAASGAPGDAPPSAKRQGQPQSLLLASLSTEASLARASLSTEASLARQPSGSDSTRPQTGSPGSSARIIHDKSGHIKNESRRVLWLRLAWANLIVMSAVTVVVMYDQGLGS